MTPELQAALDASAHWWKTATDPEKKAMIDAQRESWVRAMAPCEHGDRDWETCAECHAARIETGTDETAQQAQPEG